ncbi:hypothetical protein VNO80_16756 [Phaseolus coccineus]|uniref:Uncharacterized protein n=1 Tax=Phaseolus coccineus TaxID=3886 RepID=A0AAN9R4A3_PHACN
MWSSTPLCLSLSSDPSSISGKPAHCSIAPQPPFSDNDNTCLHLTHPRKQKLFPSLFISFYHHHLYSLLRCFFLSSLID